MTRSRTLAFTLVVVSLAGIGMSLKTQLDNAEQRQAREKYEACSDRVVDQLVTVLRDTRQVAADERAVERELYADLAATPAAFKRLVDDHLAALDAAELERTARPLPLPPSVTCGTAR